MLGEEAQIGANGRRNQLQRVFDSLNAGFDPRHHHAHDPIGRGQEKFALAGEIAVDSAFTDAQLFREQLGVAVGVAVLGEQLRGGF